MSDRPAVPAAGRRPPRSPSAQTLARLILVAVLIGGPILGVSVALDLFTVRASLQEARTALGEVRGSLGDIDIDDAAAALEVAGTELDDARRRASRPTWSVASLVPFVGPSIDITRDVVEVADAAVDLATIVVEDGGELLDDGLEVAVVDGRIDLAPVTRARELVGSLPVERLRDARDALATPRNTWVPQLVRQGRAETLQLADETLATTVRARALTEALPGFLGADGPRRYFVGFQTSAELRGTGGLIGFWGVLGVDEGRIGFGDSEVSDPFDDAPDPDADTGVQRVNALGLSYDNPPGADREYLARYATSAGARSFPNINLDPDLPTTSKAILDLYEFRTGERLDGVLLLDPPGLESLLRATGSHLPLSDELSRTLGLDEGLPTERFAAVVTSDIYDTLGSARKEERKEALQEIGDAAFGQIFSGGWEGPAMVRAIADAAAERHLQLAVEDAPVHAAFEEAGVTGSLEVPAEADLFAVVANNVGGGKQDVHLGHEFDLDVRLGDVRRGDDGSLSAARDATLQVTVDNPLPTSGLDEYIIGNCHVPGRADRCFEGEIGTNRTLFSLWASPDTRIVGFRSDDGSSPGAFSKTFRGLRVVDHFHTTASRQRASFAHEVDGRVPLRRSTESVVYELSWWRQAKAVPDLLDVRVQAPEGWEIDRVEVVGGGRGRGSGVHGAGVELEAAVVDGLARVHGTVTADTRVMLHLVGAAT
jgi:hypothetical protein